jgi:hypothetical protein
MINCVLLSLLALGCLPLLAESEKPDTRVRATEPTAVTVEATRDRIDTHEPRRSPNASGAAKRRVRAGASAAVKGAVTAAGWLLSADEVVPAPQDFTLSRPNAKRNRAR